MAIPNLEQRRLETLKEEVYATLSRAYSWLYSTAKPRGHWGEEVRSTALASLCLIHREPKGSPWLEGVRGWLVGQQSEMGEGLACWGEELWDTSMAIISLVQLGLLPTDPVVQRARRWQLELFDRNGHGNWHDEPWETSWCILSLLEDGGERFGLEQARSGSRWLVSLQDESGRIIAPHYTGYFLKIYSKLRAGPNDQERFERAARRAITYLTRDLDRERLWTGEAWSNGQILWSLLERASLDDLGVQGVRDVADWFSREQAEEGSWDHDVEDTASSILGLHRIVQALECVTLPNRSAVDNLVYETLRRKLKTPAFPGGRIRWTRQEDDTIVIHIEAPPGDQKLAALIVLLVSTVSLVITFWEQLVAIFRGVLGFFR